MTESPYSGQLYPLNDCVLVELKQSFKNLSVKEGKYDTRTEGIVVRVPDKTTGIAKIENDGGLYPLYKITDLSFLRGKVVHFDEFKEGARIKRDGKIYAFIKIEDIRGYEEVTE